MENTKFLKAIIIILLLINVSTIAFMWMNRPHPKDVIGGFFAKELQFTEAQQKQFDALKEEHHNQVESLREENKAKHDAYFELLQNPTIDSAEVNKLAGEISKIKEKEELATFYHFQKVRAICDEKQKAKFDKVINEAARMMAPNPSGRPRPPRGEDGPPPHEME